MCENCGCSTQQATSHNLDCKQDSHKQHLCYMMYEGKHYSKPSEYKKLVDEANYICQFCGRTAKDQANLCSPKKLG